MDLLLIPLPSFFLFSSHKTRERSSGLELVQRRKDIALSEFLQIVLEVVFMSPFAKRIQGRSDFHNNYITCVLFLPVHASSVLYEALLHTFDKLLASWKSENEIEPRARDMSFPFLKGQGGVFNPSPCLGQGWLIPGIVAPSAADTCPPPLQKSQLNQLSNSIMAMPIVRLSITLMREVAGLQRLSLLLH
ncbi:hypothetical protein ACJX0J_000730 (mitochondrion) [Zea mays]